MRVPGRQRTTREAGLILSTVLERQVGAIGDVVHLVEMHVVEAGGVLQQVNDAHRELRLPGVVDLNLRRQLGDRRVEIDLVVQVHLHERRGDEGLADRSGAEVRVGGHRRLAVAIGEPDAAGPLDTRRSAPARCRRPGRRCRSRRV